MDVVHILVVLSRRRRDPIVDLVQVGHQQCCRPGHGDVELARVSFVVERTDAALGTFDQRRLDASMPRAFRIDNGAPKEEVQVNLWPTWTFLIAGAPIGRADSVLVQDIGDRCLGT